MNLIQNSKFQSRRLDDQEQGLQRPHDKMIRYYTEDQMQGQRLDRIRGNIEERGEGGGAFSSLWLQDCKRNVSPSPDKGASRW